MLEWHIRQCNKCCNMSKLCVQQCDITIKRKFKAIFSLLKVNVLSNAEVKICRVQFCNSDFFTLKYTIAQHTIDNAWNRKWWCIWLVTGMNTEGPQGKIMNIRYYILWDSDSLFEVNLENGLGSLLLVAHGGKMPRNTYLEF